MTLDSAKSPRIGQRLAPEGSKVDLVSSLALPDAPWPGRLVYAYDINRLLVFNRDITDSADQGNWVVAGPGVTFVQTDPPEDVPVGKISEGDQWLDPDDEQMYMWREISANPETGEPFYGWLPILSADPYCELRASAATPIATAAWTKVNLANVVYYDTTCFSVAASVVTVLQDGTYDIGVQLMENGASAASVAGALSKNGIPGDVGYSSIAYAQQAHSGGGITIYKPPLDAHGIDLVANDTVQLALYSNVASWDTYESVTPSRLFIRKVG